MTRHPKKGVAEQPWLLYRNHPEISDIQNLRALSVNLLIFQPE